MKRISVGCNSFLSVRQLVHQFVVDVETAGGVHEDDVAGGEFRFLDRAADDLERLVGAFAGPDRCADRFRNLGELLARGGAVDVGGNDDRAVTVVVKPFGKFAGGGRLTGALEADDHPDRGGLGRVERLGVFAEHRGELVADGLDDLLVGRELEHDFAADGFFADIGEEFVGDTDVDVAFEQSFANFGESGVEVLFGELALAAKILESALKLFCKVLKHFSWT